MRIAALGLLLLVAGTACAQCVRLEFAELESLTPDQLLKMRCEYHAAMYANPLMTRSEAGAANRCAIELDRMDRMLVRKLNLTGTPAAMNDDLARRCRAIPK